MTTISHSSGSSVRLLDALWDVLLALLAALAVAFLLGAVLAVSTFGALAPVASGVPGPVPSPRAQIAPLPPTQGGLAGGSAQR